MSAKSPNNLVQATPVCAFLLFLSQRPERLTKNVMRKLWLTGALLVFGSGSISPAGCLAWPSDRECFREQTIYFQSGSSVVSAEAKQQVVEVASYLKDHPSTAVAIEGHCDDRGSEEHNRALGERRARAVGKELVRLGVPADHIDTISFGKDRPAETGHDAKARQKNRRVEFVLLTPPK